MQEKTEPKLETLKATLVKARVLSSIAAEVQRSQPAVTLVLQGKTKSKLIMAACLRRYWKIVRER